MSDNNTFYKPLTPAFRADIISSINSDISELNTCNKNVLVNAQIAAREQLKRVINALPDGYPMPMKRRQ